MGIIRKYSVCKRELGEFDGYFLAGADIRTPRDHYNAGTVFCDKCYRNMTTTIDDSSAILPQSDILIKDLKVGQRVSLAVRVRKKSVRKTRKPDGRTFFVGEFIVEDESGIIDLAALNKDNYLLKEWDMVRIDQCLIICIKGVNTIFIDKDTTITPISRTK